MSVVSRFTLVFLLLLGLCATGLGQASDGSLAAATVQSANPAMGSRAPVDGQHVANVSLSSLVLDASTGKVVGSTSFASFNPNVTANFQSGNDDNLNISHLQPNQSTIDDLDTIATFDGAFVAQAGPDADEDFRFTMAGNNPRIGGTTILRGFLAITEGRWFYLHDGSFRTLRKTLPRIPEFRTTRLPLRRAR
jgi:hypothetical protein